MGRYLRKCRAMAADVALLDAPTPLTRSRSLSHLPPNPPPRPLPTKLRPRKPPSRKSTSARPSSSSSSSPNSPPAPPAADRIRTGASEPPATCCSSNGSCELAVEVFEFEFEFCWLVLLFRFSSGFFFLCSFTEVVVAIKTLLQVGESFEAAPGLHSIPRFRIVFFYVIFVVRRSHLRRFFSRLSVWGCDLAAGGGREEGKSWTRRRLRRPRRSRSGGGGGEARRGCLPRRRSKSSSRRRRRGRGNGLPISKGPRPTLNNSTLPICELIR